MSALPPKADMCSALANVRFVPINPNIVISDVCIMSALRSWSAGEDGQSSAVGLG